MHIADSIHPGLPEHAPIFTERVTLYPEGCLALVDTQTDELQGYAISHPIRHHQPPALDSLLTEIPADAEEYYIHDLAISPGLRGKGLAVQGVGRLLEHAAAKGFGVVCLVSVYGTEGFWGRFGFEAVEVGEDLREKVKGYGDDAVFLSMVSILSLVIYLF